MGNLLRFGRHLRALLGIVCVLFGGLLPQILHADAGFSLLAAVGAGAIGVAGCFGVLILASRLRLPLGPRGSLPTPAPAARRSEVPGRDWPLLVALLFGPFSLLLAGLGGWV